MEVRGDGHHTVNATEDIGGKMDEEYTYAPDITMDALYLHPSSTPTDASTTAPLSNARKRSGMTASARNADGTRESHATAHIS